jgi:hypothetical protein
MLWDIPKYIGCPQVFWDVPKCCGTSITALGCPQMLWDILQCYGISQSGLRSLVSIQTGSVPLIPAVCVSIHSAAWIFNQQEQCEFWQIQYVIFVSSAMG